MRAYGSEIGVAFQISDDMLDLFGSQEKTGKATGNDIKEGRVTLPIIYALQQAPTRTRREMLDLLGNGSGSKHLDQIRDFVLEMGGVDYARSRAMAIEESARRHILHLPDSPYKSALLELARFVVSREA